MVSCWRMASGCDRLVFDVEVWAEVEGVGAVPAEVQFLQAWQ
jgi:hypothetical protein